MKMMMIIEKVDHFSHSARIAYIADTFKKEAISLSLRDARTLVFPFVPSIRFVSLSLAVRKLRWFGSVRFGSGRPAAAAAAAAH